MKNLFYTLFAGTLLLTGCLENTQEITIHSDGSGTLVSSNDFSAVLALSKQMGGAEQMKDVENLNKDTTISMQNSADSIPNLSEEEKSLLRSGTLRVNISFPDETFVTTLSLPFTGLGQVGTIHKLAGKAMSESMKQSLGGGMAAVGGGGDLPEPSSFDDYYVTTYNEGEITRTLDKEKFAAAESDEYLQSMKQAAAMGLTMTVKYIYNLPRPASEVTGKSVELSADKMKVTVKADIDDFFENPDKLAFTIKY